MKTTLFLSAMMVAMIGCGKPLDLRAAPSDYKDAAKKEQATAGDEKPSQLGEASARSVPAPVQQDQPELPDIIPMFDRPCVLTNGWRLDIWNNARGYIPTAAEQVLIAKAKAAGNNDPDCRTVLYSLRAYYSDEMWLRITQYQQGVNNLLDAKLFFDEVGRRKAAEEAELQKAAAAIEEQAAVDAALRSAEQ